MASIVAFDSIDQEMRDLPRAMDKRVYDFSSVKCGQSLLLDLSCRSTGHRAATRSRCQHVMHFYYNDAATMATSAELGKQYRLA